MSEQEEIKLFDRIKINIRQTQRALFERKAKLGEPVAVADNHGLPLIVTAQDALKRLDDIEA